MIDYPGEEGPAPTADAEEEIRRRYRGLPVLLADDVDINLEVAQSLLQAVGLQVDTAVNGSEAVDKARQTAYALILMDVQMPQMCGLEATRAIRRLPGRSRTPILAMTANALAEDRRSCLEAGMNDFIAKPFNPHTLYVMLRKWLARACGLPKAALARRDDIMHAQPSASTTPRARLASIPGLDLESGLERVRGNEGKYIQVLALFLRGHEFDREKISAALGCGDLILAEQLIHALKGTAGLIGATTVAEAAGSLISTLRAQPAREEIDRGYVLLASELGGLIDGLKRAQDGEQTPVPQQELPTARGNEILRLLESLLEAGDMAASTLARDESRILSAALGDAAVALRSAIEVFDYERALAELRAAKGGRPPPE